MTKLQHGSHECTLTSPKIIADGICNICYKDGTVAFACDPCNFDLCKACSELPLKLSHQLHPHHALEFCISENDRETKYMICFGCGKMSCGSFYYECSKCKVYLDIDCALQKDTVTGWFAKQMFHYSHEHLLTRCRPGPDATGSCLLCELPLSPSTICYGCVHCHLFLHERCLDLPTKIQHPVHPEHPLKRLDYVQTFDGRKNCSACKRKFVGVPFGCLECGIYLHLRCADALLRGLMHKSHEHRLLYVEDNGKVDGRKDTLPCPICMDIVLYNRFYYLCVKCDLRFHVDCLEIPKFVVKRSFHIHQLGLQIYRAEDDSLEFCGVCETIVHSCHPVYTCQECDFLGHTECILREEVPSPFYFKDMYSCIEGNVRVTDLEDHETNEVEDKLMINGFNHTHVMKPVQMTELEDEVYCNMCGGEVHDSPCKCERCSFRSHNLCAELGRSSRHQFHLNHPLTLLPYPPRCVKRKCESCKRNIDGFNLFCRICNFIIDVNCALKYKKMLGALHVGQKIIGALTELCVQDKHSMYQVVVSSSYPIACAICDVKLCGEALSCVTCEDIFHPLCIQVERRGLVGHPLHPDHMLTVSLVGGSKCIACNLNIRKYGYCCSICLVKFHLECIKAVSVPRTIKPHNHYFYHFWIDDSRVTRACNVCSTPCGVSFYGCIDCNFIAHAKCVGFPNNVKSQKHQHTLGLISSSRGYKCSLCGSSGGNRRYSCYHCNEVFEIYCLMSNDGPKAATEEEQLQDIYLMYLERDLFDLLRHKES